MQFFPLSNTNYLCQKLHSLLYHVNVIAGMILLLNILKLFRYRIRYTSFVFLYDDDDAANI